MVNLDLLMPEFRVKLENFIYDAQNEGLDVDLESGFRSSEEQNFLYSLGRTVRNPDGSGVGKPLGNIITDARGGLSWHNWGLAADVVFRKPNGAWDWNRPSVDYLNLAKLAEQYELAWGGQWSGIGKTLGDFDHFEYTKNVSIHRAIELNNINKVWDLIREST